MTTRFLILFLILGSCSVDRKQTDSEGVDVNDTTRKEIVQQAKTSEQAESIEIEVPGEVSALIGVWQDSPEIASGYSDHYEFYDNGEFTFNYNQMICDKRTVSYSGTWIVIGNDSLKLSITSKKIIVGGKLVSTGEAGSCASDYYIEGGKEKIVSLNNSEIVILSPITLDADKRDLVTRTFNAMRFWRIKDNLTENR